jgi:peptide methionine sulfoxide reductase MsrA
LWIEFDPNQVKLETLLYEWTRMHKATKEYSTNQYRSFVGYVLSDQQRTIADKVVKQWKERCLSPLHTSVEPAGSFYQAEDHHQDYYIKTGQARFVR